MKRDNVHLTIVQRPWPCECRRKQPIHVADLLLILVHYPLFVRIWVPAFIPLIQFSLTIEKAMNRFDLFRQIRAERKTQFSPLDMENPFNAFASIGYWNLSWAALFIEFFETFSKFGEFEVSRDPKKRRNRGFLEQRIFFYLAQIVDYLGIILPKSL